MAVTLHDCIRAGSNVGKCGLDIQSCFSDSYIWMMLIHFSLNFFQTVSLLLFVPFYSWYIWEIWSPMKELMCPKCGEAFLFLFNSSIFRTTRLTLLVVTLPFLCSCHNDDCPCWRVISCLVLVLTRQYLENQINY